MCHRPCRYWWHGQGPARVLLFPSRTHPQSHLHRFQIRMLMNLSLLGSRPVAPPEHTYSSLSSPRCFATQFAECGRSPWGSERTCCGHSLNAGRALLVATVLDTTKRRRFATGNDTNIPSGKCPLGDEGRTPRGELLLFVSAHAELYAGARWNGLARNLQFVCFWPPLGESMRTVSWRDIEHFIQQQHPTPAGSAAAIKRQLHAPETLLRVSRR